MRMLKHTFSLFCLTSTFYSASVTAKPIRKLAKVDNGRISAQTQKEIQKHVAEAERQLQGDQQRYEEIVTNPYSAKTDDEKLLVLSQREMFLLVDQSTSMTSGDPDPTISVGSSGSLRDRFSAKQKRWTRWNSAHVAAQSLLELATSLDKNGILDLSFFRGGVADSQYGHLPACEEFQVTSLFQIDEKFDPKTGRQPGGLTPLADALEYIYQKKLKDVLDKDEAFTVFVLTDGEPNQEEPVYRFFQKLVKNHRLTEEGRQTLAAFSFIRSGDDERAIKFLTVLDDGMEKGLDGTLILDEQGNPVLTPKGAPIYKPSIAGLENGLGVDIIDTKEDNILFGTGEYAGQENVGPLRVMHDAMFD